MNECGMNELGSWVGEGVTANLASLCELLRGWTAEYAENAEAWVGGEPTTKFTKWTKLGWVEGEEMDE